MNVDASGRYVIKGYDARPPVASFLPGIAGPLGIPLWAFYVNRGQAIASLGVGSKENSIIEFHPAVRAYNAVSTYGFRTFVTMARSGADAAYCEAFGRTHPRERLRTEMAIGLNDLEISDTRSDLGLQFRVLYFLMPSAPYGCLVRRLLVTNVSDRPIRGELIDGLPTIVPSGISTSLFKQMANTLSAWMRVDNTENGIPFYRIEATVEDRPEVSEIQAGHFYSCFSRSKEGVRRLQPIVDPEIVFGSNTALAYPDRFLEGSLEGLLALRQVTTGRAPCGLFGTDFSLEPGEAHAVYGLIGHAANVDVLSSVAAIDPDEVEARHHEARALAEALTSPMLSRTAHEPFDLYCRQTFLDNVLRGGFPLALDGPDGEHIYHVYGRRHGDLERDYNFFAITPEYFSQGNAAYRDVNQNRRCDVLIEPRVEDANVVTFMNLIQADGYNPLELLPCSLVADAEGREAILTHVDEHGGLRQMLSADFTPGQVLRYIEQEGLKLSCDPLEFVHALFRNASMMRPASFGEGYWVDHWTYNLDLIDTYLALYPDRREEFLFDRRDYTFFDGPAVVRPRSERYVLLDGRPQQLGAVVIDADKEALIEARRECANVMRIQRGHGPPYRTHLLGKLVALGAVKFSTLDPYGMGVEMEAGKPGWYDALNGLPALFGSSVSETYELERLFTFLRDLVADHPARRCAIPREVWDFLQALFSAVERHPRELDDFAYWDHVSGLREAYREETNHGVSGEEVEVQAAELQGVIDAFLQKVEAGIARAKRLNGGLAPTYFRFEPTRWQPRYSDDGAELRNEQGQVKVRIEGFEPEVLPLFLEGLVKQMKLSDSTEEAAALHEHLRTTALFDEKLGMYKVNAPLAEESLQIGRARAYTPGWLENESVFLHMHYKYLLALLVAGLYEQFWQEARRGLVPFFDPEVYGRSILEHSSFLVSSAHPDAQLHGRGFVARLSGATSEFLNMWMIVTAGARPYQIRDFGLTLELSPHLPGWLFRDDGTLSFTFLGHVLVTYHNTTRDDLLRDAPTRMRHIDLTTVSGETARIEGSAIGEPWASRIREGAVERIDVFFEATAKA